MRNTNRDYAFNCKCSEVAIYIIPDYDKNSLFMRALKVARDISMDILIGKEL